LATAPYPPTPPSEFPRRADERALELPELSHSGMSAL
jgi:hypothetical protein